MKVYLLIILLLLLTIITGCGIFQQKPVQPPGLYNPLNPVEKQLNKLGILPFISIITVGIGVAIFAKNPGIGLMLIPGGLTTLCLSLATVKYSTALSIFGLIISVICLIWRFLISTKALGQIIVGIQKVKEVFGLDNQKVNKILTEDIQDNVTVKIVKDVKKKKGL